MKISNLLIHLHNSIDAFTLKPRHVEQLRQALPEVNITVAASDRDFMDRLPDAEYAMVWVFKAEWYAAAPRLKALFTPAAGRDWVEADPSGRVLTCHGSFHGRIMRESLLSMMLYFNRRLGKSLDDQGCRRWGRRDYSGCVGLFSQRVLIVGLGALGQSMAELLKAFGAHVTGVKRNPESFAGSPFVDGVIAFDALEEALPEADHVVLLLPGGTATDGIFTARHFNAMKPGAHLYNLGRGNCYREEDLVAALEHGRLAGAGLDVFAEEPLPAFSPLWQQRNVLITPHSSAISQEYIDLFIAEWLETVRKSGPQHETPQ
ncbi:D-2-hydroxyacid dehydrogenase [Geobacter benzoatilyticus]|uniref:D-2-hydroxyacid dehydrogenase n=1 Tax=Geobacter benzoatilyticus TaxID=2815309 RepID=A0ABX7Q1Q4_9BACT|nr:D-2-hydroxyacid dehydrogenase [Geobacter benzoatilyticus]QSV45322.1 D-2-hydroxyacid dehydrogenase [Geobacter benzoatilyticus]